MKIILVTSVQKDENWKNIIKIRTLSDFNAIKDYFRYISWKILLRCSEKNILFIISINTEAVMKYIFVNYIIDFFTIDF